MTSNRKAGNVDVFVDAHGFVNAIQLTGRPLYLTSDPAILKKQFRGETLDPAPPVSSLYSHVSTDAIIKANPDCYYYDDRLGTLVLRSLGGGGMVEPGEIRKGGFGMILLCAQYRADPPSEPHQQRHVPRYQFAARGADRRWRPCGCG